MSKNDRNKTQKKEGEKNKTHNLEQEDYIFF